MNVHGMKEFKNCIRIKNFHNGQIVEMIEIRKRKRHNLEGTLNFLELNNKYNNGLIDQVIERLTQEIDALNELYNENSEKEL